MKDTLSPTDQPSTDSSITLKVH